MRGWLRYAVGAAALLAACGAPQANEFPESARAQFERTCPGEDTLCECTWTHITRAMTHEEYAAALARYRHEGLMDPRITRARTECLERQH